MSVVGIDFGNESCFVAVARAGDIDQDNFDIINTPSFVSFLNDYRIFGEAAKNQAVTNLKNTISGFKRLLGRPFNDPIVQKMIPNLPFEIVATPSGGIGIRVRYLDEFNVFSPEQITGMLFTKLKETAEHALGSKVTDCVISVPSYFTDCERRALLDSAKVAGLNVLRLFNETSAAALNYGIYKEDLPEATDPKPRIVAIVDFGHSALQVVITAFNKGKLRVLAAAQDPFLGGRNFNMRLAERFRSDFEWKFEVELKRSEKDYLRLLQEVEILKKTLDNMPGSANRVTFKFALASENKVVNGFFSRDEFEDMFYGLFNRVENALRRCLAESRVKKEDIHSVEVIGGSTRIPNVKGLIERVFGKRVSTTLNQDEAVARGCALMCALMSPTLKVKDFEVRDIQGYGIKAVWDETLGADGQKVVFEKGCVVPSTRMLSIARNPFQLVVEYLARGWAPDGWVPFGSMSIGRWMVEWVGNWQGELIELKCGLDLNGIFKVEQAQTNGIIKVKAITNRLAEYGSNLKLMIEKEEEMTRKDKKEYERVEKGHELRQYVNEVRQELQGELNEFVEENQKKLLLKSFSVFEKWYSEKGCKKDKELYEKMLADLKRTVEPIKERKMEADGRTKIMRDMDGLLEKGRLLVKMWHNKEPQYVHIPEGEMGKVEKHVKELEGWLESTRVRFGGDWRKWMVVPVRVEEILAKGRELEEKIKGVLTHPKQKMEEPAVGVEITEEDMPNANSSQQENGGSKIAKGSQ